MSEYYVRVVYDVTVKLDETKFTPEFMAEFRENFYPFGSIGRHAEHIARLAVGGAIDLPCFIEGYGPSKEMGIEINVEDAYAEVE